MAKAKANLESVGMVPMTMTRELDGFVLNRLQGAFLHEAFRLVAQGYVSAAELDSAVHNGLGPRWSFMGPFETIDLNAPDGIAQYVERYGPLYQLMAETQKEPCDWRAALANGIQAGRDSELPRDEIAQRQAWRDRRLMAFAAAKRQADGEFGR